MARDRAERNAERVKVVGQDLVRVPRGLVVAGGGKATGRALDTTESANPRMSDVSASPANAGKPGATRLTEFS